MDAAGREMQVRKFVEEVWNAGPAFRCRARIWRQHPLTCAYVL